MRLRVETIINIFMFVITEICVDMCEFGHLSVLPCCLFYEGN